MQTIADRQNPPRRLRLRLVAVVAALAALGAACGGSDQGEAAAAGTGPILDASVFSGEATTISGETVDLTTLADQDLVVWFWAPW